MVLPPNMVEWQYRFILALLLSWNKFVTSKILFLIYLVLIHIWKYAVGSCCSLKFVYIKTGDLQAEYELFYTQNHQPHCKKFSISVKKISYHAVCSWKFLIKKICRKNHSHGTMTTEALSRDLRSIRNWRGSLSFARFWLEHEKLEFHHRSKSIPKMRESKDEKKLFRNSNFVL